MSDSAGKRRGSKEKTARAEQNGRAAGVNGIGQGMTDLEFLRGLIEAVDESGIDTLEINRAGTRIRIAKTPAAAPVTAYSHFPPAPAPVHVSGNASPAAPAGAAQVSAGDSASGAASAGADAAAAAASRLVDVKSPMVGTFYRAPAPDAPPYVEVGSVVSRGQTLCILEAMKLMNEMECEADGVVREILVDDADPVEFGQVLFRIDPAGSK
jgi:acetyl-CoA carboxylase biotin carboxyl carrier protein